MEKIQVTGGRITQQFRRIEAVELEEKPAADNAVRLADKRKSWSGFQQDNMPENQ